MIFVRESFNYANWATLLFSTLLQADWWNNWGKAEGYF
jgi:hypothetical protein